MKLYSVTTIFCLVTVYVAAQQNYGLVGVDFAQRLQVNVSAPENKPSNGICFQEPFLVCEIPGTKEDYNGAEDCIECLCNDEHGVICCRSEPYPNVHDPAKCSLFLDPDTCVYTRHSKCPKACKVEGWSYSDISSFSVTPKMEV